MLSKRMRRLRLNPATRRLVRNIRVDLSDLIYPIFVTEGNDIKSEVPSMPNIYQYSLDRVMEEVQRAVEEKVGGIMLFGIPAEKDAVGSGAYAEDGIVQKAIRQIRAAYPELLISSDVCLCEYTSHGHCGLIRDDYVQNDDTLPLLAKVAVSQAAAGADILAPSDMMDGRIAYLRQALDKAGYHNTALMAHSAKFASAFYGPFRDAAGSAPQFGDRKSYQMDPAVDSRQAMAEIALDVEEGADYIIIKPGIAYLDLLKEAREVFDEPLVSYNVSGEYAMVKAAAMQGWIDEKSIVMEMMTSIKRAGADIIITYHALDIARWLKED